MAEDKQKRVSGSASAAAGVTDEYSVRITNCSPLLRKYPLLNQYFGIHSPSGNHKCEECGYSTQNKTTMLYHIIACHLKVSPFACSKCSATTCSYTNMSQHIRRVHLNTHDFSESPMFICSECKLMLPAPLNLLDHYFGAHLYGNAGEQSGATSEDRVRKYESVKKRMSIQRLIGNAEEEEEQEERMEEEDEDDLEEDLEEEDEEEEEAVKFGV